MINNDLRHTEHNDQFTTLVIKITKAVGFSHYRENNGGEYRAAFWFYKNFQIRLSQSLKDGVVLYSLVVETPIAKLNGDFYHYLIQYQVKAVEMIRDYEIKRASSIFWKANKVSLIERLKIRYNTWKHRNDPEPVY